MKDKSKTIFLVILIIAVAIGLTWFSYKYINPENTVESNTNVTKNETRANIEENNVSASNVQENKQENENKQESTNKENINEKENNNKEEDTTPKTTGESNEEKAINAVKKAWGSEEGVYFASMGIDAKGRYIVTVNDSSTSSVYAWYNVNIQTGEVEAQ